MVDSNGQSGLAKVWLPIFLFALAAIVWSTFTRTSNQSSVSERTLAQRAYSADSWNLTESDMGCLDIAITREAIRRTKWSPKPNGRKGFWVPYADPFPWQAGERKSCMYLEPWRKFRVQKREEDLVCLERLERGSAGCYWTSTKPPSERAGPMPTEASKPPFDETTLSLVQRANNELDDALDEKSSAKIGPPAQRLADLLAEMRKQAAPYENETKNLWSGISCNEAKTGGLSTLDPATECEVGKAQFQREFGLALKGDYQAQRNTIDQLKHPPLGVKKNDTLSCVWQLVSVASGDKRVSRDDISDYQNDCFNGRNRQTVDDIRTQAAPLFERIYHRALPELVASPRGR